MEENMQPVAYMNREGRIIRADVLLRSIDRAAGDSGPRARDSVGYTVELFTADQVAAKIRAAVRIERGENVLIAREYGERFEDAQDKRSEGRALAATVIADLIQTRPAP